MSWPRNTSARLVPLVPVAVLGLMLTGCSTTVPPDPTRGVLARMCVQDAPIRMPMRNVPDAPDPAVEARLAELGLSLAAIEAAHAVGVSRQIVQLLSVPASQRERPGALRTYLYLNGRILAGTLAVSSIQSEIDCENERGDALLLRVRGVMDRRSQRLNLAAIIVGAGTAALTGGLSVIGGAVSSNVVGIAGGGLEAGLGLAMQFDHVAAELRTPQNALAEIWNRPAEPTLIPRPVWRYLTRPGSDGSTRLDSLISEWRAPDLIGEPGSDAERERAPILFGTGGMYTAEMLEVRDELLDQLQAVIGLMSRSIRILSAELHDLDPR